MSAINVQAALAGFVNILLAADKVAALAGAVIPGANGAAVAGGAAIAEPILSSLETSLTAPSATPQTVAQAALAAAIPVVAAKNGLTPEIQAAITDLFGVLTALRWPASTPAAV